MFRKIIKKIQEWTFKPLILWYLKKERGFTYKGLKMSVLPGVFHPLFFYSTLILSKYLQKLNVRDKSFLEPGCGSGMVSILAAKAGARVTSLDLNPVAVENTIKNAKANNLNINVIHSNLFTNLQKKIYDFIFINPPYYPSKAKNDSELAWYCGSNFEYFTQLFEQLPEFYNSQSQVIMILSEDCDLSAIQKIAQKFNQKLQLIESHNVIFEKNYLFRVVYSV